MANETKNSNRATKITKSTIALFVCLGVIGALILATILMAVIPTDRGVKFSKPDQMTITYDGKTAYFESDSSEFGQIWTEYQKAGKSAVIAALFGGYAGQGMKANYFISGQDYSDLASKSTSDDDEDNSETASKSFVVKFVFNNSNKQTMVNGNGSTFEYKNADTKLTFEFIEATFEVSDAKVMQSKTFYLKSSLDSATSTKTHITYTGVANFNSLYDLLKTMVEKNKFIS